MKRIGLAFCVLAVFSIGMAVAQGGATTEMTVTVFSVVKPGASPDATRLFLEKMGGLPAALKMFSPSGYVLDKKGFRLTSEGQFGYSAEGTELVGGIDGLELYSSGATIRCPSPPKPDKTITVTFSLKSLATGGGIVQPGSMAIELAARKAKKATGKAWIIELKRKGPRDFVAVVGLSFK